VSLAAQRARLADYARAMDLQLVEVHEDAGASGGGMPAGWLTSAAVRARAAAKRPGLIAALDALDSGRAEGLLIVKLDRLTRSMADLGALVERYFASRSVLLSVADAIDTRTAGGRLVLNVLGSVAEWERDIIRERTREKLAHMRAKGVRLGGEALGWRRVAKLGPDGKPLMVERKGRLRRVTEWARDEGELEVADRIRELRRAGLSLRAICDRLHEEGRPAKRGGSWVPQTVARVLQRLERAENEPAAAVVAAGG
jgi:DNA invertase Pin-like site-specific DNA recombinase